MATPKLGIKETGEVVTLVGRVVSVTADISADGKVSLAELLSFLNLLPVIGPAVADIKQVPAELADLDDTERAELKADFSAALHLPNPITEELFIEGSDLALHLVQFIAKVRAAKQPAVAA